MNPIARARRILARMTQGRGRRAGSEPADMGTAFGLDAITTLEPAAMEEMRRANEAAATSTDFERRLLRRSGL